MNPFISVITPSLNQGRFIERTLLSVERPVGLAMEHVVMDGGSTDDTVDILRRFANQVRWVSEKDAGQADAVNKGILSTKGEIIGWLNSDDVYYPGALARVADFFRNNASVDAVYGMADYLDPDDRAFEPYPTEPWNHQRLNETCFICQPALFFRRHLAEEHGLLDTSLYYCMDYEYWLRLAMRGARFAYLPEKLAGSRLYPENKTMSDRIQAHHEICAMLKKRIGRVPYSWLSSYAHAVAEKRNRERPSIWSAMEMDARVLLMSLKWNARIPDDILTNIFRRWMSIVTHVFKKHVSGHFRT